MTYRDRNREIAIAQNIAENGRWGTLAMVAIALQVGNPTMAFLFALTLFIAYVTEALDDPWRVILQLAMTAWAVVLLVVFAVTLLF